MTSCALLRTLLNLRLKPGMFNSAVALASSGWYQRNGGSAFGVPTWPRLGLLGIGPPVSMNDVNGMYHVAIPLPAPKLKSQLPLRSESPLSFHNLAYLELNGSVGYLMEP